MKDYYTGHHACSKDGGKAFVQENSPFISEYSKDNEKDKLPFLGTGYYFWEYDLAQAQYWGRTHYNNNYFVISGKIKTTSLNFLDLVGDKEQMSDFVQLAKNYNVKKGRNPFKWQLGYFIEFLKRVNKITPNVFPYSIIRASDYDIQLLDEFIIYFRDSPNYTYLNPRHIFCLILKDDLHLQEKTIIFES